ncbi:hypothetical protein CCHL11_09291, partial [Colletotrichum chlorophyti]
GLGQVNVASDVKSAAGRRTRAQFGLLPAARIVLFEELVRFHGDDFGDIEAIRSGVVNERAGAVGAEDDGGGGGVCVLAVEADLGDSSPRIDRTPVRGGARRTEEVAKVRGCAHDSIVAN